MPLKAQTPVGCACLGLTFARLLTLGACVVAPNFFFVGGGGALKKINWRDHIFHAFFNYCLHRNDNGIIKKRAFMNNGSGNHNTCQKRRWDLWCRENGSLLLKWQGCLALVGLQRENDTTDRSAWLPPSRVDCRSMRVAVPSGRKCSRRRKIDDVT